MAIPSLIETELTPDKRLNRRASKIIHFTGPEKPGLVKGYHPWSWVCWESLQRTPFLAEGVKREKVTYLQRLKLCARWKRRGFRGRPRIPQQKHR